MVAMQPQKRKRGRDERDRADREQRDDETRNGRSGGGGILSGALQYVRNGAHAAAEQVQRTIGDTGGAVLDSVLDEAERLYEEQRKNAVSRVSGFSKIAARSAHALHAVKADGVAEYVEQAAKQVERSTDYLRDRDLSEILEDTGDVIRRNPGAAMGGMFIVGFAITRFLKASATRDQGNDDEAGNEEEQPTRATQKRRQRQ